ncbi:hypothetical protein CMZ84_03125 [Lysobacteraceae bacterium NML93-0399]|nr:hypothetical protein CMZ84_03125 [Xanthomonadaceae bacterium NML93-0399]
MPARAAVAAMLAMSLGIAVPAAGATPQEPEVAKLEARYAMAVRRAITQQWTPPQIEAGASCRVQVRQLPGGDVLAVEARPDCGFDAPAQDSLVRAVHRAAPLPYVGFEDVYVRDLTITFTAPTP